MHEKAAIEEAVRCRLSLLRYLDDERLGKILMMDQMGAFDGTMLPTPAVVKAASTLRAHYFGELMRAPTWVIEQEVVDTLADAWESYPTTTAYSTDILTPSGFALLAQPVPDPSFGEATMMSGMFWTISDDEGAGEFLEKPEGAQLLTIMFLTYSAKAGFSADDDVPRLYPYISITWLLDVEGGGHLWQREQYNKLATEMRVPFIKFFLALFAIVRDRLAEAEEPRERSKKAADKLKHASKKYDHLNRSIKVVRFQPRTGSGNRTSTAASGRKLTVRSWTRPFWRWQWYPSTEENKPKLIRPFQRGPEGAPEVGRERILLAPKPLKDRT